MTEALRTFQGLTFSCPSPSCLRLVDSDSSVELYYCDGVWQLWGREKTGEPVLTHTGSRDNLIGIIAWVRGLRDSLPEGFVYCGPEKAD